MVPFWIRLLMSSNHYLVSFNLVHSIKNGKGKKNTNFQREFQTLDNDIFCVQFLCENAALRRKKFWIQIWIIGPDQGPQALLQTVRQLEAGPPGRHPPRLGLTQQGLHQWKGPRSDLHIETPFNLR